MDGLQAPGQRAASTCIDGSHDDCETISTSSKRARPSLERSLQKIRQFLDRTNQKLRTRRAQTLLRWEGAEHANRADAGAPSHLHVLRRVADVDARRRVQLHLSQRQAQRLRMRLLAQGVPTTNARRE